MEYQYPSELSKGEIKLVKALKNKELKKALNNNTKKYRVKEDCVEVEYEIRRLTPRIPASNEFKRDLRDLLIDEWKKIHKTIEYKAGAEYVLAKNTMRACPRCGSRLEYRNGRLSMVVGWR